MELGIFPYNRRNVVRTSFLFLGEVVSDLEEFLDCEIFGGYVECFSNFDAWEVRSNLRSLT